MKLSGLSSWQTTSDVPVISFNLKEILAAQNRPIVVRKPPFVVPQSIGIGDGVPIVGTVKDELENLGVWTLKTRPKAYWNTTQKVDVTTFQDEGSSICICGTAPYPTLSKTELDVEINPYLKSYVQSHSVSVKYIGYVSKDPSGYISKTPRRFNKKSLFLQFMVEVVCRSYAIYFTRTRIKYYQICLLVKLRFQML